MFTKINFSTSEKLLDPILYYLMPCSRKGFVERQKLLNKCNDRFSEEVDILALISKVRDTYGMLRFLRGKQHKALLRFQKDRTIVMSEDSEKS